MTYFSVTLLAIRAARFAGLLVVLATAAQAQSAPFESFEGSWSGNGTVMLSSGASERIRCRATYAASGNTLKQALRCASDSYKFEFASSITSQGNQVSGNWSETSRGINGTLQGTVGQGQIKVFAEAAGFAASITLIARGNRLSTSISSKSEIRNVSITMIKS